VQALSEAPGTAAAAAGNSSAAGSGLSGSKLSGGVKAMFGSLLPSKGAHTVQHYALGRSIKVELKLFCDLLVHLAPAGPQCSMTTGANLPCRARM
jgi:hypothetical protein